MSLGNRIGRRQSLRRDIRRAVAGVVEALEGRLLLSGTASYTYSSDPTGEVTLGNTAYFFARQGDLSATTPPNYYLYKSDGTADGTVPIVSVGSTAPSHVTPAGSDFFFFTNNELWSSDGTAAGTKSISASAGPGIGLNGALYYKTLAGDKWGGVYSLTERVDGTTGALSDFFRLNGLQPTPDLFVSGDTAYYISGNGVIETDGRTFSKQAVSVPQLDPGYTLSEVAGVDGAGGFYLTATNQSTSAKELIKADATGSTVLFTPAQGYLAGVAGMAGNRFVFSAAVPGAGHASLWATDGTPAGTSQILDDVAAGIGNTVNAGDNLYFETVAGGANPSQLVKTDGTSAGTTIVSDGANAGPLIAFNGSAYFTSTDPSGATGTELWKSDGTQQGTGPLKDIAPGPQDSRSTGETDFTVVGGKLLFTADDVVHGSELWATDGTSDGTVLLDDINAVPAPTTVSGNLSVALPSSVLQDPNGESILSNFRVGFGPTDDSITRYVRTDSTGDYSFDGLTPGTYAYSVQDPNGLELSTGTYVMNGDASRTLNLPVLLKGSITPTVSTTTAGTQDSQWEAFLSLRASKLSVV